MAISEVSRWNWLQILLIHGFEKLIKISALADHQLAAGGWQLLIASSWSSFRNFLDSRRRLPRSRQIDLSFFAKKYLGVRSDSDELEILKK